jgi:hypothetical protein
MARRTSCLGPRRPPRRNRYALPGATRRRKPAGHRARRAHLGLTRWRGATGPGGAAAILDNRRSARDELRRRCLASWCVSRQPPLGIGAPLPAPRDGGRRGATTEACATGTPAPKLPRISTAATSESVSAPGDGGRRGHRCARSPGKAWLHRWPAGPFRDYSGFGILPTIPSPGLFRVASASERGA